MALDNNPISLAIESLKRSISPVPHEIAGIAFRKQSSFEGPATAAEIEQSWPNGTAPRQLVDLWAACRSAKVFADIDYGQSGLTLLSPVASRERSNQFSSARPEDWVDGDVIFGDFIGDSERLVFGSGEHDGSEPGIFVALEIMGRSEWPRIASAVDEFLRLYESANGEKYWLPSSE